MKLPVSIAISHLLSRKRQTIVSLMGISLGVAFFLAVASLMYGSELDFIKRLVDNSPHVTVYDEYRNPQAQPVTKVFPKSVVELRHLKPRTEVRGIRQYKEKLAYIAKMPGLRVAPILTGQTIVSYAGKDLGVSITGVVPDMMKHVTTIEEHFVAGSLDSLTTNPDGIIIGIALAEKLRTQLGQNLTVASSEGVVRTMKIVGLFSTGNTRNDETQTYVLMKRAQNLLNRPNAANRFVMTLNNTDDAPRVAQHLENVFGYKTQPWQETTQDLMSMIKIRNTIMYSVVSAILIVASFGIYNVISTVVMEKTRDIAIMKSVGFHARDIRRIFLVEGAILGAIGSIAGTLLGLGMMLGLSYVRFKTPFQTEETYMPVYWGWGQIAIGASFAIASALAAAYLPARKGGRMHPVDILRGSA
jgi:lipoprotein-releasing system permease protein